MRLTQLNIDGFRNLSDVSIQLNSHVNLITGDNAAGKTSILESIYYLSHIRSFRTPTLSDLIQRESNHLQITATVVDNDKNLIPMGIRRSRKITQIRVNKQPVKRASDIASFIPVLAIHPDSYKLITGSPNQRRQYMDWGVFHVEQYFFQYWQRFKKTLSQRNAALKSKQDIHYCQLWDNDLILCAEKIDSLRMNYISNLQSYFSVLSKLFFKDDIVIIEYKRGWPDDEPYDLVLKRTTQKDRLRGHTYYGPQRGEINIKVNGQSAQTCISRGQQKTLVALLRLAQAQQFTESSGKYSILLYDDLAAELDDNHKELILDVLSKMKIQLFLTAIKNNQIDLSAWKEKSMFHVEHGEIINDVSTL